MAQLASVALVLAACGGSVDNGGSGGAGAQAGSGGGGAQAGSGGAMGGSGGATGGFGGATGGSGGVTGGSGGLGGGTGGAPCGALEQAYSDILKQAKVCNPFIEMNECTAQVADQLACPCGPTFVNAGNGESIKMLQEIQNQWQAQDCGALIDCPAIACDPPAAGACELDASGSNGSCQDYWLNGA